MQMSTKLSLRGALKLRNLIRTLEEPSSNLAASISTCTFFDKDKREDAAGQTAFGSWRWGFASLVHVQGEQLDVQKVDVASAQPRGVEDSLVQDDGVHHGDQPDASVSHGSHDSLCSTLEKVACEAAGLKMAKNATGSSIDSDCIVDRIGVCAQDTGCERQEIEVTAVGQETNSEAATVCIGAECDTSEEPSCPQPEESVSRSTSKSDVNCSEPSGPLLKKASDVVEAPQKQRAVLMRNPFLYEQHILAMTCRMRLDCIKEAFDKKEFINPSFFGYVFVKPGSLDEILEGMELMKQHWKMRSSTQKEPDYIVASRQLIPLLLRHNQHDLLLNIIEHRWEHGIVKGHQALTDVLRQWQTCGRVDLVERLVGILINHGDKINPVFIQATTEAYLNAGLFHKAKEFLDNMRAKGSRIPTDTTNQVEVVLSRKKPWFVSKQYAWKLKEDGSMALSTRRPRIGSSKQSLPQK